MLVPATCPRCGAAIQLESAADWVTCQYCSSSSFIQKPTGPAPPPNQTVISIDIPGVMPMRVHVSPGGFGGPMGPPGMSVQQATYQANARVAGAQMYAAHQMNNAYAEVGRRFKMSMIITVVMTLVIFLFVGGVVIFSMFGSMMMR